MIFYVLVIGEVMIKQLLNEFWQWMLEELNKTQNDYNENGLNQILGEFEFDFPKWEELFFAGLEIVNKNKLDDDSIFDLLTVMGLDNEGENILDHIEEYSSEAQFEKIIEIGLSHPQYETRWQLTELLERKKPIGHLEKLKFLAQDRDSYVRQRARGSISYMRFGEGWDKMLQKTFFQSPPIKIRIPYDVATKQICEFCQNEIGTNNLPVGYTTENNKLWICDTCYNDELEFYNSKPMDNLERLQIFAQNKEPYIRQRARNYINRTRFGKDGDEILKKMFSQQTLTKTNVLNDISPMPICEFCQNEIGTDKLPKGYTTENNELWICETCYNDCKDGFELKTSD